MAKRSPERPEHTQFHATMRMERELARRVHERFPPMTPQSLDAYMQDHVHGLSFEPRKDQRSDIRDALTHSIQNYVAEGGGVDRFTQVGTESVNYLLGDRDWNFAPGTVVIRRPENQGGYMMFQRLSVTGTTFERSMGIPLPAHLAQDVTKQQNLRLQEKELRRIMREYGTEIGLLAGFYASDMFHAVFEALRGNKDLNAQVKQRYGKSTRVLDPRERSEKIFFLEMFQHLRDDVRSADRYRNVVDQMIEEGWFSSEGTRDHAHTFVDHNVMMTPRAVFRGATEVAYNFAPEHYKNPRKSIHIEQNYTGRFTTSLIKVHMLHED